MGIHDEMLAAADRGEYGTALRLARQRLGWTQAQLGLRVGRDRSVISRFECGAAAPQDLQAVHDLANALDVSPFVLGAARFGTTAGEGDDMRRRQVLVTAGLVLAGVPLGVTGREAPRRIGLQHALDVRADTDRFRAAIYERGAGRSVRQQITDLLDRVTVLIRHASNDRVRHALLDALGDLAGLNAYAYRDLGAHEDAQQYYLLAVRAARAAEDSALVGHLVVRMAGQQIELGHPDEVLGYLEAARSATSFGAGELSNQYAIAAWAQAQRGAPRGVQRAVGMAEEHFANRPDPAAGTRPEQAWLIRHTAEAELFSLTGAAYSELARHDPRYAEEAVRRLRRARALREEPFARNDTLDAISLAEAYLAAHDVDEAVSAGTQAVVQAQGSYSRRVRMRLSAMADLLVVHNRRSDAADLIEQVRTLRQRDGWRL